MISAGINCVETDYRQEGIPGLTTTVWMGPFCSCSEYKTATKVQSDGSKRRLDASLLIQRQDFGKSAYTKRDNNLYSYIPFILTPELDIRRLDQ